MIVELNNHTWVESQNVTSMRLYEPVNNTPWRLEVSLIDRDNVLIEFDSKDEAVEAARMMGLRHLFTQEQIRARDQAYIQAREQERLREVTSDLQKRDR